MPIVLEPLLPHLPAFAVVVARIAGLFIFTPVLSSNSIPLRVKALLVLVLSGSVYPTIDHGEALGMAVELHSIVPMMASELLIGAVIGLIAAMPMYAVQLAGLLIGQQIGLGLAQVVNPAMDIEGDNLGQLLFLLTLSLLIGMGGLEVVFGGMVYTFAAVPLGGFGLMQTPLGLLTGMLAGGFDLALRLAMPALAVIFVETVVLGFVMKTMPTLNIMSFGFPIKIVLGLFVVIVAMGTMKSAIVVEVDHTLATVEGWVASLFGDGVGAGE